MQPYTCQITGNSDDYHQAAKVGQNAGPADRSQRAVRETDVMNQENADRQHCPAPDKHPGKASSNDLREFHPRLKQRQEKRQRAKGDQVNVSINLCAAVLKKPAGFLEMRLHSGAVARFSSLNGSTQACTYTSCVLVQDNHGKDIAKNHSRQDHANACQGQQTPCAEGRKARGFDLRGENGRFGKRHMEYPWSLRSDILSLDRKSVV